MIWQLSIRPDRKAGDPTVVDLKYLLRQKFTGSLDTLTTGTYSYHHEEVHTIRNQLISTSWSHCNIRSWKLRSTSSRISIVSRASHLSRLSCVLWQSHTLIKHVQSSWANTISALSLCRQIGLVRDRYIEDLYFWADKLVIYNQIIMRYYYLTEWPVIIDFINLATRPIIWVFLPVWLACITLDSSP